MSWRISSKFAFPWWCFKLLWLPVKKLSITITWRGVGRERGAPVSREHKCREHHPAHTHMVAARNQVVHQVAAKEAAAARHCAG